MVAVTQTQATASHLAVTDTRASQDWVSRELDQHWRQFVVVRRLREASLDALSTPCPGRAALQTSGYWLTAACAVLEDLLGARGHRPRPAATRDPGRAAGRMSYARMAADGQLPTRGRAQGAVTTPNGGRSTGSRTRSRSRRRGHGGHRRRKPAHGAANPAATRAWSPAVSSA